MLDPIPTSISPSDPASFPVRGTTSQNQPQWLNARTVDMCHGLLNRFPTYSVVGNHLITNFNPAGCSRPELPSMTGNL